MPRRSGTAVGAGDGARVDAVVDVVDRRDEVGEVAVVDRPEMSVEPAILLGVASVEIQACGPRDLEHVRRVPARAEHDDHVGRDRARSAIAATPIDDLHRREVGERAPKPASRTSRSYSTRSAPRRDANVERRPMRRSRARSRRADTAPRAATRRTCGAAYPSSGARLSRAVPTDDGGSSRRPAVSARRSRLPSRWPSSPGGRPPPGRTQVRSTPFSP